ncbi:cation:proton antiporter [Hamadaea tsunoensis]|uniref:cation:proton antiporter n=1 Tax=Hamadaea tsunoensis TaxID=53368 RepID=UPI001B7FEEC3|nr:cation:proton antiporter [Hamadaea tsunoensis]
MQSTIQTLTLIALAAVLSPIIADLLARWVAVPAIVLELLFGVLIGPFVLGWAALDNIISAFSSLGLAILMFMAGYEIDFPGLKGRPLRLAVEGWLCSLVLGLALVAVRTGWTEKTLVIGLALTTTALGTLLPILRDRGQLGTPFGNRVMAVGAIGEFAPIVTISIVLTTDKPGRALVLLALFVLLAVVAAVLARRPAPPRIGALVTRTLTTSAQFAIRLVMLVLVVMVFIAYEFGLDTLLGSFAAGIVVRLATRAAPEHHVATVESKLDAVGFGFLVPIFFVVSGLKLNLDALSTGTGLLLTGLFLLALLVVRGGPIMVLHRRDPGRERVALALLGSSALPLIVVITGIGTDDGVLTTLVAAALVAAGALSVLIYPQVALRLVVPGDAEPARVPAEPEAL